jgi:hypothetical protein
MSEENKTKPTEEPRIEMLSNCITELLQSIKKLGNDTPKTILDTVEDAVKNIGAAKDWYQKLSEESEKKNQDDAEKKEIAERDALCEKVREIFESAIDAELKVFDLMTGGKISEGSSSRVYIAEKRVIQDINERVLKNTPYTLCKYFRRSSNVISYPFHGCTPTEVEGDGIILARKDKVSEYENRGFDGESLFFLSQKKFEDMSIQDCINVAKYTGAPSNTETFVHLLDHLVRLGAWHVCTCKKAKTSKRLKVKKEDIIQAYKALIDRMTAFEAQSADMEIVD